MNNERIKIFIGHFGSGKTEVALNYTQQIAQYKENTALVDLDVINSYFRSREAKNEFILSGANIIAPEAKMAFADLPVITPQIKGLIADKNCELVFDVGGDNLGTVVLSSFAPLISKEKYEMYMVVNPFRPYTRNLEQSKKMFSELEATARLKITAIISNPNLGFSTTIDDLINGHTLVEALSEEISIPIKWLCAEKHLVSSLADKILSVEILPLHLFMQPPWLINF